MRKLHYLLSGTMLALTLAGATSCSDDDKETYVNISEDLTTRGIETDMLGAYVKIPIESNAKWQMKVNGDNDWIDLIVDEGKGQGLAVVSIAENLTGIGRHAEIELTSGDETKVIKVVQGIDGANAANNAIFPTVSANYGLGVGVDFSSDGCVTKASIINFACVNDLIEHDDYYELYGLYDYTLNPFENMYDAVKDSIEEKMDSLGVHFSLDISFSKFKFGVSGNVTSNEVRKDSMFHYKTGATYASVSAQYDVASIYAAFCTDEDEFMNEYLGECKDGLLANGFKNLRMKIDEARRSNDNEKFAYYANQLIKTYGSLITTQTEVGGIAMLDAYADALYCIDTLRIDSAKVEFEIKASFQIDMSGKVDYNKTSNDILRNSNYTLNVVGGGKQEIIAMTDALQKIRSTSEEEGVERVRNTMTSWLASLNADLGNRQEFNSNVVKMDLIPIWYFFDYETSMALKDYILSQKAALKEYDAFR